MTSPTNPSRPPDDTTRRIVETYAALLSANPDIETARNRLRKAHAILGGKKPKRSSRKLPSKASIKRRIDAAEDAGLTVTGITADWTVLTGGKPPQAEPDHEVIL